MGKASETLHQAVFLGFEAARCLVRGSCTGKRKRGPRTGGPGGSAGQRWEWPVSPQGAVMTAVREWEARNAQSLREQEARARLEQEQEQLLTYTREDAYSAVRAPGLLSTARAGGLACLGPARVSRFLFPAAGSPHRHAGCDASEV